MTNKEMIDFCELNGMKPPSGLRKRPLTLWYEGVVKHLKDPLTYPKSRYDMKNHYNFKFTPKYADPNMDWMEHFKKYGWTTVQVLTPEECKDYQNKQFTFFEEVSEGRFDRDDRSTWIQANMPHVDRGIYFNVQTHHDWVWDVRYKCTEVFSKIWNVDAEDLLSSFGSIGFMHDKSPSGLPWLHTDQHRTDGYDFMCAQGIVNLREAGPDDGGLILVEGSNLAFGGYMDRHPCHGLSFGMTDMTDESLKDLNVIKVCSPPGHIMLWDSRTVHCNVPPTYGKGGMRQCVYVSQQPRKNAKPDELKKRRNWYEAKKTTNHACYGEWLSTKPKRPNRFSSKGYIDIPWDSIEQCQLTDLGRRLVGYDS
jgi:hypothetical protein